MILLAYRSLVISHFLTTLDRDQYEYETEARNYHAFQFLFKSTSIASQINSSSPLILEPTIPSAIFFSTDLRRAGFQDYEITKIGSLKIQVSFSQGNERLITTQYLYTICRTNGINPIFSLELSFKIDV